MRNKQNKKGTQEDTVEGENHTLFGGEEAKFY